jgi:hypothetical protein
MPLIYARQPCTTALRLLGVAAAEQPVEAHMAHAALEALNSLLDAWSTDNLLTYTRPKLPLALVPGQQVYTWGEATAAPPFTPDIAGVPPVRLDLCLLDIGGTPVEDWQVTVLDQTQFESYIWLKTMQSTYVEYVYLEDTVPVKRLHVWPVPLYPGYTLQLLPWPAQPQYTHWDEGLEWPNGYLRLMAYNLAVEIAPEYECEASPTVMRIAEQTKRDLAVVNARVGRLALSPGQPAPRGWAAFVAGRAR